MEDRICGSILWKIDISNKTGYLAEIFFKQNTDGTIGSWNITVKHEEERMTRTNL